MSVTLPGIEAAIEEEQAFFDTARALREDKRERRELAWQQAGSAKDRARLKANAEDDNTLADAEDAVAFLRLDLEDGGTCYVGTHGISDGTSERIVHSWKAPAILHLRGARHDEPRGVVRRRTFRTAPINTIQHIDDVVLVELARQVRALGTSDASLLADDEFLQDALSRSRTPEMQTIVQTIQAAQSDVIAAPHDALLVVQGGPGTGKTAIALHRVAALLYGPLKGAGDGEVLVVGPNPTFLKYIAQVLPELGEASVQQLDIGGLMSAAIAPNYVERPPAAALKGDGRMVEVLARALTERIKPPQGDASFGFDDVSWQVTISAESATEILDDVERYPYASGRARFRELIQSAIATEARRTQRSDPRWTRGNATPRPRPGDVDAFVERVWPQLTPAAFLRDLFGSLERLVSAAGSTLTADELALLRRQAAPRLSDQLWSKEDLPLLDHVAMEMSGETRTYAHIVVDEVQDLSAMQLLALRRRSRDGAMTLVGDIAQSTGHWARDSWDEIVELLASPLTTNHVLLEYGYRVPRAVMELAARLLPEAAPGIAAPTIVRDVPDAARLHAVDDTADQFSRAVQIVQERSGKGLFVGVICPDDGRHALAEAFRDQGIQWNDADKGGLSRAINVVSPGASKGLEFDAVVVVDPETIVTSGPHGLRMLYIALTRTTSYLDVVHVDGRLPPLLAGPSAGRAPTSEDTAPPEPAEALGDVEETAAQSPPVRDATPVTPEEGGDRTSGAPTSVQTRGAPSTARQRAVSSNADNILELLADVAPPHLWPEILAEARARIESPDA